ncbi:hypothetical protein [Streptomyces sp. NPDC050560]|uniref:hypothetical protein n=1 Tax=Streptomyces sp. NPDC050560 TaxID=3365630 RepID=UPI00379B4DA1
MLAWHPQPVPLEPALCALAPLLHAAGVVRLRRRGDDAELAEYNACLAQLAGNERPGARAADTGPPPASRGRPAPGTTPASRTTTAT